MTDTPQGRITPFSSGSQYHDWVEANCERCTKGPTEEMIETGAENTKCDIEQALARGSITGYVTKEIAERMGFFDHRPDYVWACPEIERAKERGRGVLGVVSEGR